MNAGPSITRDPFSPRGKRRGARPRRGSGRPPGSDGEATRRRIVEAARVCFGECGYKDTANHMIADRADLTPAVIYHYFDNKQHLFLAVQEQTQSEIQAALTEALEPLPPTLEEAVRIFLRKMLEIHLSNPGYSKFNAVVRTEAVRNPEIAKARNDVYWRDLFRKLSDLGVRTGELDPADARLIRHALSSTVLGLTQQGVELEKKDLIECSAAMQRLFDRTLLRGPQGAPAKRSARRKES